MADLATHSLNYSVENERISPFATNDFEIDDGVFCDFTSQNSSAFYQERENGEDEILNNYDTLQWPELGKHTAGETKIRHGLSPKESMEILDHERIFALSDEDTQPNNIGCEADSKPQTYASVLQKTLKLKIENDKAHRHNGSNTSKNEKGTVLYGSNRDNNNVAVVFGDKKYIFKWNFIDILSHNVPETFDRKEVEFLAQIYWNFMRSAFEKFPICPQGKEIIEFSSLLMLVGSRIELHDVDGVSQLYYCLNKGWTEEDSIIAHKSYLPPYNYMREYEGSQKEENKENDANDDDDDDDNEEEEDKEEEVLSAKAQAVCTYGFDLNTALTISKDLWGCRSRMAYTEMFSNIE